MPRERRFGPRFTRWPREAGLGYDFKQGSMRGIMQPAPNPGHHHLTEWRIQLWVGADPTDIIATVWGDTPWTAIENLDAFLEEED